MPESTSSMDRQRNRPGKRSARKRARDRGAAPEPVLIAARRPNAPLYLKARASASAAPKKAGDGAPEAPRVAPLPVATVPAAKRVARIVKPPESSLDQRERERERLLGRLLESKGRAAVTRAAKDYRSQNFEYPCEQAVQLQLLEHLDEEVVREALDRLVEILSREPLRQRPVLEQRLKRVEDTAEDAATRARASELLRGLRS